MEEKEEAERIRKEEKEEAERKRIEERAEAKELMESVKRGSQSGKTQKFPKFAKDENLETFSKIVNFWDIDSKLMPKDGKCNSIRIEMKEIFLFWVENCNNIQ